MATYKASFEQFSGSRRDAGSSSATDSAALAQYEKLLREMTDTPVPRSANEPAKSPAPAESCE